MRKEKQYPTPFQKASCWAALTGLSLTLTVTLVCALAFGLGRAFIALAPALLPVIVAGILAYLLFPCVVWVQKRVKNRLASVLIVMATAALGLGAMAAAILPPLIQQSSELISQRESILSSAVSAGEDFLSHNATAQYAIDKLYEHTLREAEEESPAAAAQARKDLDGAEEYPEKLFAILNFYSGYIAQAAMRWLSAGTRAASGIAAFLIGSVMIPVFLFYFLLHSGAIARNWHTIIPLRRSNFRTEMIDTLRQINNYLISFVRGQMLVSLIDGVLLGIALKIMGLPYAVTIAAAAALLGIIPYIGMISTSIPALLIAWFTWHDFSYVLGVAGIFIGVNQFDGWVLQPRILGNRVGMHDLTIMFSVLFWGAILGGIVGALLAVPLTASIKVIFMRYVWPSLGRDERPFLNKKRS